jgi:hypothetical protein
MGFVKRFAFYLGLVFGVVTVAAAGSVALTYLLTGKVPLVGMSGDKAELALMTPDEVAALIREKAGKAREVEVIEVTGGGDDGEA